MDCSLPCSSIRGIFQARVLEWIAISFSRGSSQPRNRTQVSCVAGRHYHLSHQGSSSSSPSELRYIVFLRQESAVAPFTWQAIKLSFSTSPRFCLKDSIQHQCREAKLSTLLLTPCTIQICKYRVVCHRDSLQDEKECYLLRRCLVDAKRMFLYMVEQVFLPMGRFDQCVIQIHIAQ